MQPEPSLLDRIFDAGAELRTARIAPSLREKWAVDLLDVDAVVDRLHACSEFEEFRAAASGLA